MNSETLNYLKIKVKKKKFVKNELKLKVLQSIFQNKKLQSKLRLFSFFLKLKLNNKIYKQQNICLMTGKTNGLVKDFFLSRNCLKKFLNHNKIQNTKINSW